jgi:hypothetical protein
MSLKQDNILLDVTNNNQYKVKSTICIQPILIVQIIGHLHGIIALFGPAEVSTKYEGARFTCLIDEEHHMTSPTSARFSLGLRNY